MDKLKKDKYGFVMSSMKSHRQCCSGCTVCNEMAQEYGLRTCLSFGCSTIFTIPDNPEPYDLAQLFCEEHIEKGAPINQLVTEKDSEAIGLALLYRTMWPVLAKGIRDQKELESAALEDFREEEGI